MNRSMRRALLAVWVVVLGSAVGAEVIVTVGNATAELGTSNIEVPITVQGLDSLAAISADLHVNYDSARFIFTTLAASGTLSDSWRTPVFNPNLAGQVRIAMYDLCVDSVAHPLGAQGCLLKLYFDVKPGASQGNTVLSLSKADFGLSNGTTTVTATMRNGALTLIPSHSAAARADLSGARVFPNPYRPASATQGDTALGSGIVFDQLTAKATIRILTIAGEQVRMLEKSNGDGFYVWDGRNESGQTVASGVYLYRITNPDDSAHRAKGKLAIVR